MAISLRKGEGISLRKEEYDLSRVTIGLGWDIAEVKQSLLSRLAGGSQQEHDLDVVAFLCNRAGKVENTGRFENGNATLQGGDVVFFNSLRHPSGQIWLTGDNLTGAGDGDDEQIVAQLATLPESYHKIVFVVQIYQGHQRNQSFGQVKNAYIRAVDARDREMVRFDLSGGAGFEQCRSMLFAELIREAGGWRFNAVATPYPGDSFVEILKQYW